MNAFGGVMLQTLFHAAGLGNGRDLYVADFGLGVGNKDVLRTLREKVRHVAVHLRTLVYASVSSFVRSLFSESEHEFAEQRQAMFDLLRQSLNNMFDETTMLLPHNWQQRVLDDEADKNKLTQLMTACNWLKSLAAAWKDEFLSEKAEWKRAQQILFDIRNDDDDRLYQFNRHNLGIPKQSGRGWVSMCWASLLITCGDDSQLDDILADFFKQRNCPLLYVWAHKDAPIAMLGASKKKRKLSVDAHAAAPPSGRLRFDEKFFNDSSGNSSTKNKAPTKEDVVSDRASDVANESDETANDGVEKPEPAKKVPVVAPSTPQTRRSLAAAAATPPDVSAARKPARRHASPTAPPKPKKVTGKHLEKKKRTNK